MELVHKYRPKLLKQVIGQESAVKTLRPMLKSKHVPHALLFTGPSGCGKTTLARIVCRSLGCQGTDLVELNCADARGIDTIREIRKNSGRKPLSGGGVCYILDEVHKLTGDAQTGLLKPLEEPPSHVYYMLCTTDPHKLLNTIKTRCTEIKTGLVGDDDLLRLVQSVVAKEELAVEESVLHKAVEVACGSPRKALVLLNQVAEIGSEEEQIEALEKADADVNAIVICRALFRNAPWKEIAKALRDVDQEPETVRRRILVYADKILLTSYGKTAARAYYLIERFRDHFYDCGKAGLTACCYDVCNSKQ